MLKVIRNYDKGEGVTSEEAQKLGACTLSEANEAIKKYGIEKYYSSLPWWTSTYVEYNGENCKVTENGKTEEIKLPLKDGWYKVGKFGIPCGEPSNSDDPDALYLWRTNSFKGFLARGGSCIWLRRYVYASYGPTDRLGVAIVDKKLLEKVSSKLRR